MATELGRTPRINQNDGRDHYPKAFSCLMAGGGVKGGVAYGKTDESGSEVIDKPVTVEDFNATIAYGVGLSVNKEVISSAKRPFTVGNDGEPVTALFA